MRRVLLVVAVAVVLSGCCGFTKIRYWRATDLTSGNVYWTADAVTAPIGRSGATFLSSTGKVVGLASFELEAIDEPTFQHETGGAVASAFFDSTMNRCSVQITPGQRVVHRPPAHE